MNTENIYCNKNIGIIGGTFNPVHYGHLLAAQESLKKFNLKEVIFMPVGKHVYKNDDEIVHKNHRYKMLNLATLSNDKFSVSDLEINKNKITYTLETITQIKKIFKNNINIFFIIGSDLLEEILSWKDVKQLFKMCEFIVVLRDYSKKNKIKEYIDYLKYKFNAKIHFLKINNINISSTDIRYKIINNESIKYLLPENVEEYIYKNNLYKSKDILKIDFKLLDTLVKSNLSKYRYEHSKRAALLSVNLAKLFNEDKTKAYFAGFFHDFAKEMSPEKQYEICLKLNIKLDFIENKKIQLAHGRLAAEIAKEIFKIKEENILNAIRYHTTGRKNMTKLEKIIYIADKIEVGRQPSENLNYIRNIIYNELNLDKAVLEYLKFNMKLSNKKEIMFHPLSIEAITYIENNN